MKLCLGGEDQSEAENRGGRYGTTDRESVYRAHVALIREKCKVHGYTLSIKMYATVCAGGCAIYKFQRNWCIRRSCTPTATYEARAVIKKSDHLKMLSIILPSHRKKSVLRGHCERNPRCAGLRGGS
ncbi:hypothetical protein EVAR_55438_1 [Eumeta japonica]|uniref:Uncharacterized protein n=1 Tax=Eumeta variegata TaxID=151549 RepID=A0A4C1Y6D5_EUMVA|nr:hypothetical protein EVAR_55438_1 [Eumeta japonica]